MEEEIIFKHVLSLIPTALNASHWLCAMPKYSVRLLLFIPWHSLAPHGLNAGLPGIIRSVLYVCYVDMYGLVSHLPKVCSGSIQGGLKSRYLVNNKSF